MTLLDQASIDITPWCIRLDPAAAMSPALEDLRDERGRIDLGDPRALNLYNQAALRVMAGLEVSIPPGHLVPTVCLRQAYLTVLMDGALERGSHILEIGTGASAIISLLAAKIHGLVVTATEIDSGSYNSAMTNINSNNMSENITLLKSEGEIIKGLVDDQSFDAVVCYPPTYPEDDRVSYEQVGTGFQGTVSEMIGGGDDGFAFIARYLREAVSADIRLITVLLIFEVHLTLSMSLLESLDRHPQVVRLQAGTRTRYLVYCYNP